MNVRLYGCLIFVLAAGQVAAQPPGQLWTQATIYRDGWGVPHVYGDNPRALAFAFGYAQAEDRLETLMRAYRIATGRAAAVFGPDYADSDAFALKMGHSELAEHALENAPPLTRDLCEGFALGVNAWIADHPALVPEWADGARPSDVLALLHSYLMSFAPFDLPGAFHRPPAALSGNAWALGPARTESGAPVLVINPHGHYDGPFQWYEAHLAGPHMNVAGATLCGLPVILQGHNEVLGWALTPNYPDFADIYVQPEGQLELPPGDPTKMQLESTIEQLLLMRHVVEARPFFVNTPTGMRQRSVPFRLTRRGPVVGTFQGEPAVFKAGGYWDFGTLEQLVGMASARNLGEFHAALAMRQLPCFHILYADREGNIFYLYNARVGYKTLPPSLMAFEQRPQAGEGEYGMGMDGQPYVWEMPVPGNDFRYAWGPLVPLEALPAVMNPASGYLQACGTPPWGVTEGSGINPEAVPLWLAADRDTFRAQRARHLLGMGRRTFQEAQAMVYDVLVPFAAAAVPQLIEWTDSRDGFFEAAHPDTRRALDVLRAWNFVAETNSPGMTVFNTWWTAFRQLAGNDVPDAMLYQEFLHQTPHAKDIALEAASHAAREMRNLHDAIEVPWGEVHRLRRGNHEEPIPGGLAGEPLVVTAGYGAARRKLFPSYGYAYAMAVQFGQTPESVSVLPGGVSEDPASEHFADQLRLFSERRFKINHFLDSDVQRYAERAFGRRPALRPVGMQGVFGIEAPIPVSVRLETTAVPPAPLPDGMAPYTVFVTPVLEHRRVPVEIDAAIFVPPSVLEGDGVDQLAVYVFDPAYGWVAVPQQHVNAETRILRARFEGTPTCVVLGPARLRALPAVFPEETPPLEAMAEPPLEIAAAEDLAPEALPAAPLLAEPVEDDLPLAGDPPVEPEAQATLPPSRRPAATGPAVPEGAARSALAWGKSTEIAIPGEWGTIRVQAQESLGVFASASQTIPAPLPAGLSALTPFVGVHRSVPSASATVQVMLSIPEGVTDSGHLYVYRPETGWQRLDDQHFDSAANAVVGSDTQPGVYAVLTSESVVVEQPLPDEPGIPMEAEVPAPALPAPAPEPVAPEPAAPAETPSLPRIPAPERPDRPVLAWGRSIELAAEETRAHFAIEAEASIGAFTRVSDEPPAPLPDGLRAYSRFIALSVSTQGVALTVRITMYPDFVLPDGIDSSALAIYAHDPDTGWARVEGQQPGATPDALTATDTQPRTYAILGPAAPDAAGE